MCNIDTRIIQSTLNVIRLDSQDKVVAIIGRIGSQVQTINLKGTKEWVPEKTLRRFDDVTVSHIKQIGLVLESHYNSIKA